MAFEDGAESAEVSLAADFLVRSTGAISCLLQMSGFELSSLLFAHWLKQLPGDGLRAPARRRNDNEEFLSAHWTESPSSSLILFGGRLSM